MKFKTTAKAIRNGSTNVVSIGYADACHLLNNHKPIAYTYGVYGWNFDVYEVYGLTICTGYRGMVGRNAKNVHEYDRKAREILSWDNTEDSYETKREKVETLLKEFCEQA